MRAQDSLGEIYTMRKNFRVHLHMLVTRPAFELRPDEQSQPERVTVLRFSVCTASGPSLHRRHSEIS